MLLLIVNMMLWSCGNVTNKTSPNDQNTDPNVEAREDSLALIAAYAAQEKIQFTLEPSVETEPIAAASEEDAADDPAIWINPIDPSKSLIYGSNKKGGLAVYNLVGVEVDYYPLGNINNVDIIYNFPFKDSLITILGCSNRSDQSIDLLQLDAEGKLQNIANSNLLMDTLLIDDIYGFCFAKDLQAKKYYAIINGKNGLLQQFELINSEKGVGIALKRSIQFDSQTEGMVADSRYGFLYVGEEGRGIWKINISPGSSTKSLVAQSDYTNPNIVYDIEGLSIYEKGEEGFLVASIQGNFSYAVFDRKNNNEYLGSFKIKGTDAIDGVEETDGLDIVSDSLGEHFPHGILVVQDGFNYKNNKLIPQNFKFVKLGETLDVRR